jgi:hypothetical protein
MEARIGTVTVYHIELTREEAEWLKDKLQNPVEPESSECAEKRRRMFDCLREVL